VAELALCSISPVVVMDVRTMIDGLNRTTIWRLYFKETDSVKTVMLKHHTFSGRRRIYIGKQPPIFLERFLLVF